MDEAMREYIAMLNAAWQEYDLAKQQGDDAGLDALNETWEQACTWLAAHGHPWETLTYDFATFTFSLPTDVVDYDSARLKSASE